MSDGAPSAPLEENPTSSLEEKINRGSQSLYQPSTMKEFLELLESGLLDILSDKKVKQKIIQLTADELPLPNFIEKRLLNLVYNALLEAVNRIYQENG